MGASYPRARDEDEDQSEEWTESEQEDDGSTSNVDQASSTENNASSQCMDDNANGQSESVVSQEPNGSSNEQAPRPKDKQSENEESDSFTDYKTCKDLDQQSDTDRSQATNDSLSATDKSEYQSALEDHSSDNEVFKTPKSPPRDIPSDGKPKPCHAKWDTCVSPKSMMKVSDSKKLIPSAQRRALNKQIPQNPQSKVTKITKVKVKIKVKTMVKSQVKSSSIEAESMSLSPKENDLVKQYKSIKSTSLNKVNNFSGVFKTSDIPEPNKNIITKNQLQLKINGSTTKLKTTSVDSLRRAKSMQNIKMPEVYKDKNKNPR